MATPIKVACWACQKELRDVTPADESAAADGWFMLCDVCGDGDRIDAYLKSLPRDDNGTPILNITVTKDDVDAYDRWRKEQS